MRPRLLRAIAILIIVAALTSCRTDVFGPYVNSISEGDIQQIKALVAARPDIHKFILGVVTTRPELRLC